MRRNSVLNKRMPTFLGMLFLGLSIGLIAYFAQNATQFRGRAAEDETPRQIQITNITDKSFNVSFKTDIKVPSAIAYGTTDDFGPIAFDDRDKDAGAPTDRQLHYITVTNLSPNTTYYFAIRSGAKVFLNGDLPYEITTAAAIEGANPSNQQDLKGSVNLEDGTIPLEGVVYISSAPNANTPSSQTLSTLTQVDGSYTIPLNNMLKGDLGSYFEFKQNTLLTMSIVSINAESKATLLASQTHPVPLITLGKDYDFAINISEQAQSLTATDSASASDSAKINQEKIDFPEFDTTVASGPAIIIPEDGQEFTSSQPKFEGTAIPNSTVELILESINNANTVLTDDLGNWSFVPESTLGPGVHVLTLNARNSAGVMQSIKRTFVVHADGSQFNEPSIEPIPGQPTFTPTPTPTATPTPTETPTPSPTEEVTPTPNLTLTMAALSPTGLSSESLTLTAAQQQSQTTTAPVPASGNLPAYVVGLVTLLSIVGSIMFFLL